MNVESEKVRGVIEPILTGLGYELVDVRVVNEQGRWILRVFVDREGGVTLGDCATISREIDTPLEIEGVVPFRYNLEVSTPGLNRPLVKRDDFLKFSGKDISVRTEEPIEGRKNFKGRLEGMEEEMITMMIDGTKFRIPLEKVKKANLIYTKKAKSHYT